MTPNFIQEVGNRFDQRPLNFRNQIFHSRVTDFHRKETDSGLSVKFVQRGTERYRIDGRTHAITPGRFLIVNEHQQFECTVQDPEPVEGLCIYLDPESVYELYLARTLGQAGMLERDPADKAPPVSFLEKVYALDENELGELLHDCRDALRVPSSREDFDFPWFFEQVSERLVDTQLRINKILEGLDMETVSTREEIYRRVSKARNFIEENYRDAISLDELASEACFSKYHFLRCFKAVYSSSPYQYLIRKRLSVAASLLCGSDKSLQEVAMETGFADRRALNKAFRKGFGLLPSDYRANC